MSDKAELRREADRKARRYTATAIVCELQANWLDEGYFYEPHATPEEKVALWKALKRLIRRLNK